jgi:AAA15 family ATPase/GTPase
LFEDAPDLPALHNRMRNQSCKKRTLRLLNALDLRISDLRVVERAHRQLEFLCAKEGNLEWVEAAEYSTGAYRLVGVLPRLLDGLENSHFVGIDEFDTHLHPMIARFLLQMIAGTDPRRRLQLLAVTHTTALLDLDFMRRDEIWLMSMAGQGASKLTRLIEHSPRRNEGIARAYLRGRYDAIPQFSRNLLADF